VSESRPTRTDIAALVLEAVDANRDDMVASLQTIVQIPSVSPNYLGVDYQEHVGKETEVTAALAELYRRAGATVDTFTPEAGRTNAVASLGGGGKGRSLAFNGHVDVVPSGDQSEWTIASPFSASIVGSRMYGRGTTDMKSGLIAQAYAAIALQDAGITLAGELQLQCVVGEETGDLVGTAAVLDRGYRAEAVVVSEPSAPPVPLSVVPASPGFWWLSIQVTGKRVHAGMRGYTVHATGPGDEIGVNAIDKAFKIYSALRDLEETWARTQRHELWPNGYFALLPGTIKGGPGELGAPFALSDSATIEYAILYHPERSPESIRAEVQEVVDRTAASDHWLAAHPPVCDWKQNWNPFVTQPDAGIVRAVADSYSAAAAGTAFSKSPTLAGFAGVCDATWFAKHGMAAVVFGPGDLSFAHGPNEFVELDEVWLAARAYALLAVEWCGVV
jgi:acetylornithine deacetylase/succinyl-diaminopimelate desuccinylase family protein